MPRLPACLGAVAVSALLCGSALAASADSNAPTLAQSVDAGVREAQLKRAQNDYTGAVKVLSQLMLVAADDPRVVGEYGKVLVQQGRTSEALDFLHRAVQLQQNDWMLYSALGVAYDQKGDYANAKLAYEHALTLKPGESAILNNYAMSRMQAGDLEQAKQLIASASAASKDDRIARNQKMIASLKLPVSKSAVPSTAVATANPAHRPVATTAPHPLNNTHPMTSDEGRNVVMQAVPNDPLAGPVGKPKAKKTAAAAADPNKKNAPKASSGKEIPALRLTGDRP